MNLETHTLPLSLGLRVCSSPSGRLGQDSGLKIKIRPDKYVCLYLCCFETCSISYIYQTPMHRDIVYVHILRHNIDNSYKSFHNPALGIGWYTQPR